MNAWRPAEFAPKVAGRWRACSTRSGSGSTRIHRFGSGLLPDKTGTKDFAHEKHTKAPEGAAIGGAIGIGLGAVLGWLVGIGSLTNALVGLGIPESEAKRYEGKIIGGSALISVHTDSSEEASKAKEIFEQAHAEDISSTGETSV